MTAICLICKIRRIYKRYNLLCLLCMSHVYQDFQNRIQLHGPIGQEKKPNPLQPVILRAQQGRFHRVLKEKA